MNGTNLSKTFLDELPPNLEKGLTPAWLLREAADQAKNEYAFGQITREQAQERIQPYLDAVNEKSKEISKKYGKKHKDVSFIGFIR